MALRNLGGIVVIDFIDLENRNKRDQVMEVLRAGGRRRPGDRMGRQHVAAGPGRAAAPPHRPDPGGDVAGAKWLNARSAESPLEQAYRPFCSARCKKVDLNRWLSDVYRVPADATPPDEDDKSSD